ncbi:hypothetical protein OQA88_7285 [Cercophora sp. LCS_1]
MAGYSNGADSKWNQTSQDTSTRLGGDSNSYALSASEIAVVVATLVIFLTAVGLVFYCRNLHLRRETDIKNQEKERAEGVAATVEGETIELKDGTPAQNSANPKIGDSEVNLISRVVSHQTDQVTPGNLEAAKVGMRPLWHYVHWKDPYKQPKQTSKPRPLPEEEEQEIPANPYYAK